MGIDDQEIDDLVSAYRERLEREKYEGFHAELTATDDGTTRGTFRDKHELHFDEPEYVRVSDGDTHPCPHDYLLATVGGCQIEILKQCLEQSHVEEYDIELEIRSEKARAEDSDDVSEKRGMLIRDLHTSITVETPERFRSRAQRCAKTFEEYCSISQSVKLGIEIHTTAGVESTN